MLTRLIGFGLAMVGALALGALVFPWSWPLVGTWSGLPIPPPSSTSLAVRDPSFDVHYLLSATSQSLAALVGFIFSATLLIGQLASGILPRGIRNVLGPWAIPYFAAFLLAIIADLWFLIDVENAIGVRASFVISVGCIAASIPFGISVLRRIDPLWWVTHLRAQVKRRIKYDAEHVPSEVSELTELGRRALANSNARVFGATLDALSDIGLEALDDFYELNADSATRCARKTLLIRSFALVRKLSPFQPFHETKVDSTTRHYNLAECAIASIKTLSEGWAHSALRNDLIPFTALQELFDASWHHGGRFDLKVKPHLRRETAEAIGAVGLAALGVGNRAGALRSFQLLERMTAAIRLGDPLDAGFFQSNEPSPGSETEFRLAPVLYKSLIPVICNFGIEAARSGDELVAFAISLRITRIAAECIWDMNGVDAEMAVKALGEMAASTNAAISESAAAGVWTVGAFAKSHELRGSAPMRCLVLRLLVTLTSGPRGVDMVRQAYLESKSGVEIVQYPHDGLLNIRTRAWHEIWLAYESAYQAARPPNDVDIVKRTHWTLRGGRRRNSATKVKWI